MAGVRRKVDGMESGVEKAEATSSYITFIQFPRTFDLSMMCARNPGKNPRPLQTIASVRLRAG
jgi:hypothetical protein